MAELSTSLGKLKLENPTMLASGILGDTGESLLRVARSGAGAVVTKSIGREPREGNPGPSLLELEHGLLNAIGLANPGIDDYGPEMEVALQGDVPVIGSIFAEDIEFFGPLARTMEVYGAQALELNLSCPHAEGLEEIAGDAELIAQVTSEVKSAVKIPIFVKLSPNVRDIVAMARAVEEAEGDGITAINTVKAMSIAPEVTKPVLGHKTGGLSGPAIRPIGVRCVYDICEAVNIPVIGVGGILTGLDAVEYIMAGATAVQIGSGIHYRGIEIFKAVCEEIEAFMEENGYKRVEEMVGIAHE
ncbi:MAG: dihydroorotate dehydrogenase [Thermoplasmata archaeon]